MVAALDNRIGDAVVVGHNIGYDLAVIDREYAGRSHVEGAPVS